jgi:crotonobetainyl-CoA:carnitine CoA-transferase CaiB-like acyl-CoA transferase
MMSQPQPLPAWRVLDMSQAISGPYAGRILADLAPTWSASTGRGPM